jgi:hypothetical protein
MVLCELCHSQVHKAIKFLKLDLSSVTESNVNEILTAYYASGGKTPRKKHTPDPDRAQRRKARAVMVLARRKLKKLVAKEIRFWQLAGCRAKTLPILMGEIEKIIRPFATGEQAATGL